MHVVRDDFNRISDEHAFNQHKLASELRNQKEELFKQLSRPSLGMNLTPGGSTEKAVHSERDQKLRDQIKDVDKQLEQIVGTKEYQIRQLNDLNDRSQPDIDKDRNDRDIGE